MFFATERWPLTVNLRRGVPSLGMSCAPLTIGLFLCPPAGVLLSFLAGSLLAAASHRPLRLGQTAFSMSQFALLAGLAVVVFHALAPSDVQPGWAGWGAAAVAISVVVAGNLFALTLVALQETRPTARELWGQVVYALAGAVASTCFGLITVSMVMHQPEGLVLLGLAALAFLVVYRAYVAERQDRLALEFLHGAGESLGKRELESAIVQLLQRARTMFSAEMAQLTIFPSTPGEKAFRTTVRTGVPDQVMEPLELNHLDDILEAETDGVIVDRLKSSTITAEMLARRGIHEAMVALLRGESRLLGSLLVGGHVDSRTFDARDLQLFRTLAIQTSTTLENGRLERSIARLTELQEKLTHQAFHDSLTDLANRTLFGDRIDHALQRSVRIGRSIAVLFIDVDDFKGVNDTLGHAAGDSLLVGIAERLRASLRRPDTAARLGGDEFAVLIEDLEDTAEAEIIARRIFDSLRAPFEVMGHTVNVRVSIGLAISQGGGDNASNLMRHA
ncbi:MAG: sensor domain-containing diguanylate cyclase, partial [Candidatus Dormibacteraeota bacterium]|nr:sensor domain-containing diguanylate cyclase [Candidatus Dormibacteraeota bacterium]